MCAAFFVETCFSPIQKSSSDDNTDPRSERIKVRNYNGNLRLTFSKTMISRNHLGSSCRSQYQDQETTRKRYCNCPSQHSLCEGHQVSSPKLLSFAMPLTMVECKDVFWYCVYEFILSWRACRNALKRRDWLYSWLWDLHTICRTNWRGFWKPQKSAQWFEDDFLIYD